ncbi:MAG: electron transfer flavoprotein beta subunit/FixA family protein [Dehalococcoidia bacterium]|nr:electron transfer flavoprotein beta subunit/FixA family protein [Dehalococcoidia bacterium]
MVDCIVTVKGVPDFREGKVHFKEDNTLNRGETPTVLNPSDRIALMAALEIKVKHGGKVTVVSMGPLGYKTVLQEALEVYGDDAYLFSDRQMGGADTLATAYTLGMGMKKIGLPDIVISGFKTADGETGQTGPQTAWLLDYPIITHVISIEVDTGNRKVLARRLAGEDIEEIESPLPCYIITDPNFEASYRSATHRLRFLKLQEETRARAATIDSVFKAWNATELGLDPKKIGLKGSPTIVNKVEAIPTAPRERTAKVISGKDDQALAEVAKQIAQAIRG